MDESVPETLNGTTVIWRRRTNKSLRNQTKNGTSEVAHSEDKEQRSPSQIKGAKTHKRNLSPNLNVALFIND